MGKSANVAILRFGRGMVVQFAAPGSERVLGCRVADVMGCTLDELPLPDTARAAYRKALHSVRERGEIHTFNYVVSSADGEQYFQVVAAPAEQNGTVTCVIQENSAVRREVARLRNSEREFRRLAEHSPDVVARHSPEGKILYVSRASADVLGYRPEEMIGRSVWNFLRGDRVEEARRAHDALLERRASTSVTTRVRKKSGEYIWLETSLYAVRDPETGAIRELQSTSRDVTARQQARQQVEQLNKQLALRNQELFSLYESGAALGKSLRLQDIYWALFEKLGKKLLNSPHFVVALYDEEKDEISCQFAIVDGEEIPPETFPTMPLGEGPTSDAIRTGEIQIVDLEAERKTLMRQGRMTQVGDERLTMSALYLPLIGGSRVQGVLSFQSYDRAAYKEVNHELISTLATQAAVALANGLLHRQTETHAETLKRHVLERTRELEIVNKRMFSILDNATDGILLVNQNGIIEVANSAFDRLFGYDPAELVGRSVLDITFDTYRRELQQTMSRTMEKRQGERLQIKCLRKDRTTFDGELSLSPVTSHPQHDQYLVCTLFDISEFKTVERMKDQFISTVNHEIRTPITGILLSADSLSNYYERLNDEQRLRKIEQIRKQGQVLVDLINAILDLARLEDRENERGTELVDMIRIVTDVCAEMGVEAEARRQRMELRCRRTPLYLIGDATDLERIWRNLIGNAIKYTDEGGEITVSLEVGSAEEMSLPLSGEWCARTYAVGHVSDSGRGIGERDLPHLFTRFYRGWAKTSRIPGTGLGLTMVREILELYDGGIAVESNVGEGTTFTFWIPVD